MCSLNGGKILKGTPYFLQIVGNVIKGGERSKRGAVRISPPKVCE